MFVESCHHHRSSLKQKINISCQVHENNETRQTCFHLIFSPHGWLVLGDAEGDEFDGGAGKL
jgi:hypothetical protein